MRRAAIILAVFAIVSVVLWLKVPERKDEKAVILAQRTGCRYYNQKEFLDSVNKAKSFDLPSGRIRGGIVPHHLLAADMIAGFFKAISVQKPELVVIIGPNHKRLGNGPINTSECDWNTPFGVLKTDNDIVGTLTKGGYALSNPGLMEEEHSISALIPYVKYFMPDVRVVPLLLNGNLGLEESEKLGDKIIKAAGDRNFIMISSIDFSHYLSSEKADKMDVITWEAIENRDLQKINRMTNDNLDSPPSMITLLTAMEKTGAVRLQLLEHSNSAKITGQSPENTTSYFTILFAISNDL